MDSRSRTRARRRSTKRVSAASSSEATASGSAADFIPPRASLSALRAAARACRGCHLWRGATQTVFGEGLLDEALEAAGIDRRRVYVTNAVKHFKFVRIELTKRRLHKKPTAAEVRACHPWPRVLRGSRAGGASAG